MILNAQLNMLNFQSAERVNYFELSVKQVTKDGGIKETKMKQEETRESAALPLKFELGPWKL